MERMLAQGLSALRAVLVTPVARRIPRSIGPTVLTGVRLFLVLPLIVFLLRKHYPAAVLTYLVAVATDALDGEVARLRGATSRVGARLDPTVDKVIHGVIFITFWRFSPLLLSSLLATDVLLFLMGLVIIVYRKGDVNVTGANVFGKWKFTVQTIGVLLLFLARFLPHPAVLPTARAVLSVALIFAFLSAAGYLQAARGNSTDRSRA